MTAQPGPRPPLAATGRRPGHVAPPRPNPQWGLPVVQCLAVPLYWWAWRAALGAGPAAAILAAATPFLLHAAGLGIGFAVSWRNQHQMAGLRHSRRRDWLIAFAGETAVSFRQFYWLMPFRERFEVAASGR